MRLSVLMFACLMAAAPARSEDLVLSHKFESFTRLGSSMAGSNAGLISTRSLIASVMLVGAEPATFKPDKIKVGPYDDVNDQKLCGYFWTRNGQYQAQVEFVSASTGDTNNADGRVTNYEMSFASEHAQDLTAFVDMNVLAHARVAASCSSASFDYAVPLYTVEDPQSLLVVLETGSASVTAEASYKDTPTNSVSAVCDLSQDLPGYECRFPMDELYDMLPASERGVAGGRVTFEAQVVKKGRNLTLAFDVLIPKETQ